MVEFLRPFKHAGIQETSGIVRSQPEDCNLWVHDDSSGAGPVIYAIDGEGAHLAEAWLDAPAVDWEDIASFALDGSPYLLTADAGNNGATRNAVTFLVSEPSPFDGRPCRQSDRR